jgi:hypothetical protein
MAVNAVMRKQPRRRVCGGIDRGSGDWGELKSCVEVLVWIFFSKGELTLLSLSNSRRGTLRKEAQSFIPPYEWLALPTEVAVTGDA